MSNLVKAIMATDTGERKLIKSSSSQLFRDVFSAREDTCQVYTPDIGTLYRIGVTLGSQVLVPDHTGLRDPNALEKAVRRTKEQVIEAVFGEFRPMIRQIELHLHNYEHEEAARLLGEMERKMFGVD